MATLHIESGGAGEKLGPLALEQLAERMCGLRGDPGVSVKDRHLRMRTHKSCFIAYEAVDWFLTRKIAQNVRAALSLGEQLLAAGFFHEVEDEDSTTNRPGLGSFQNNWTFYRFAEKFRPPVEGEADGQEGKRAERERAREKARRERGETNLLHFWTEPDVERMGLRNLRRLRQCVAELKPLLSETKSSPTTDTAPTTVAFSSSEFVVASKRKFSWVTTTRDAVVLGEWLVRYGALQPYPLPSDSESSVSAPSSSLNKSTIVTTPFRCTSDLFVFAAEAFPSSKSTSPNKLAPLSPPSSPPLSPDSAASVVITPDPLESSIDAGFANLSVKLQSGEAIDQPPQPIPLSIPWEFVQSFGDDTSSYDTDDAEDLVTAIKFSRTGEYFAIGDKAGRVSIVREAENVADPDCKLPLEYTFFTEFQSHDTEFDVLKSITIEPKINAIEFWHETSSFISMLTTTDKTVRLWSLTEGDHSRQSVTTIQYDDPDDNVPLVHARSKKTYKNAHTYNIHSISPNSDGATFISADDLRINLWDAEVSDETYTIVDLKPNEGESIGELITTAAFHPTGCNEMLYGSSQGIVRLADLRTRSLLDRHCKSFGAKNSIHFNAGLQSGYVEAITRSVLSATWSGDGQNIVTRNFTTLSIWDPRKLSRPVVEHHIHGSLKNQYHALMESEAIFDQFRCAVSDDGRYYATGTYGNSFFLHSTDTTNSAVIQARDDCREPHILTAYSESFPPRSPSGRNVETKTTSPSFTPPMQMDEVDFQHNILHVAFHPRLNALAVAGLYKLYLYLPNSD